MASDRDLRIQDREDTVVKQSVWEADGVAHVFLCSFRHQPAQRIVYFSACESGVSTDRFSQIFSTSWQNWKEKVQVLGKKCQKGNTFTTKREQAWIQFVGCRTDVEM